jgi:hypothetical protein
MGFVFFFSDLDFLFLGMYLKSQKNSLTSKKKKRKREGVERIQAWETVGTQQHLWTSLSLHLLICKKEA